MEGQRSLFIVFGGWLVGGGVWGASWAVNRGIVVNSAVHIHYSEAEMAIMAQGTTDINI